MKRKTMVVLVSAFVATLLSGCSIFAPGLCAPGCRSQTHHTSSLVSYLYPNGATPPPTNTIPELHVPLRVGLAFLPSQGAAGTAPLDAAQRQRLLEQIRQRFASRSFVSEIVIIPDYYLGNSRGFAGLEGVQRLYNVDLMALVSYDQVIRTDDNQWSLGYLTIVGAYFLPGSRYETATLVDLAVVDPATRSLVLRAGGTNGSHERTNLINLDTETRDASAKGFDEATTQLIRNFDTALTDFQADVRSGKAKVRVVARDGSGGKGGGGAIELIDVFGLLVLAAVARAQKRLRFS